jgi:hypothetical protein
MAHFTEQYADKFNELLHVGLASVHGFLRQEIIEVPGLLTAILVTYDGVRDDQREIKNMTWEGFLERMSKVKPDWRFFDRTNIEKLGETPERTIGEWEGRTIYFIRGGQHHVQWTPETARKDAVSLFLSAMNMHGPTIQHEVEHLREIVPAGHGDFRLFEDVVRLIFNFLFLGDLGEGRAQSRTDPEDEGVEIRDLVFRNQADSGFWKDLKDKYSASEVVVDAKNKDLLTRDDLRQLYCYLKPALGFWGFIVCRSEQPRTIHAFSRDVFNNFIQSRGLLILCDDDLRRMVQMKNRGQNPTTYLREKMSDFVRSV